MRYPETMQLLEAHEDVLEAADQLFRSNFIRFLESFDIGASEAIFLRDDIGKGLSDFPHCFVVFQQPLELGSLDGIDHFDFVLNLFLMNGPLILRSSHIEYFDVSVSQSTLKLQLYPKFR